MAAAPPSQDLRIGTFNAYLLSPIFKLALFDDPDQVAAKITRAKGIAKAICTSAFDYDVIALNEVWPEYLKAVLVTYLATPKCAKPFPFFQEYSAQIVTYHLEDSGLMIFSRFPLLPIPPSWHPLLRLLSATGLGGRGIFAPFELDCIGEDCGADKGAVLVRILNPTSGRTYDVVFTHTQADSGGEFAATRRDQFRTIKSLFNPLSASQRLNDQLFVLGDLNVVGDTTSEWTSVFETGAPFAGGFFAGASTPGSLFDSWARTQSTGALATTDPGLTSPGRNERLDYIVPSQPRDRICVDQTSTPDPPASPGSW